VTKYGRSPWVEEFPASRVPSYPTHRAPLKTWAVVVGGGLTGALSAYALAAAGVKVEQLKAHGHFHSSFAMVDVVVTGVEGRTQMAEALRRFAGLPPEVSRGDEHGHGHASPGHKIAAAAS